jgi:hypothetical protein
MLTKFVPTDFLHIYQHFVTLLNYLERAQTYPNSYNNPENLSKLDTHAIYLELCRTYMHTGGERGEKTPFPWSFLEHHGPPAHIFMKTIKYPPISFASLSSIVFKTCLNTS